MLIDTGVLDHFLSYEISADSALFYSFVEEFKKLLCALENEGVAGDPENLKQLALHAHKMKTSCVSLGAPRLGSLVEHLESVAIAHDILQVKVIYSKIMESKDQTIEAIVNHANDFFGSGGKSV